VTTFAGLRSQLRGLFAAVLVLCVLVAGFPGAAFAVDYADPEYAIGVSNYGYTDEGMTVSMLAEDLGASPRATLALACWVDSWVVGSDYQQLTASQMANVASGVQAYMVQHDTWDSFTETVEGLTAIGSSVYLTWARCGMRSGSPRWPSLLL
jgi:ABC-type sugar transport system substrate-binding protein